MTPPPSPPLRPLVLVLSALLAACFKEEGGFLLEPITAFEEYDECPPEANHWSD